MFLPKITDKYLTTNMKKEILNNRVLRENYENFRRLVEYTNGGPSGVMAEAGDENQPDPMAGPDPSMGGAPGGPDPMGGGDPSMGGGMDAGMGGDPSMGGGDPMAGGDPSMGGAPGGPDAMGGGDPSMGGGEAQPPQGFSPQGGEQEQLGATPETDPNQEEEEVIDVDDLTNSQEETEKKIDALSDKFERLIGMLDGFEKQIDSSNERMETLKAEIEKRNPTPVEKMSLRAKNSYPFNITPDEYWKDKEATSNYSPEDDNNGADDPVYQITKNDIDNISDWNQIYKSLDDKHDSLRDLFGY